MTWCVLLITFLRSLVAELSEADPDLQLQLEMTQVELQSCEEHIKAVRS